MQNLNYDELIEELENIEYDIEDLESRISELEDDDSLSEDDKADAIGNLTSEIDDLKDNRFFELEELRSTIPSYVSELIHSNKLGDYAESFIKDNYNLDIPDWLVAYIDIDYRGIGDDLSHDMECVEIGGESYFYVT